ncbi:HMG box-containing protein 4 [Fopius arisanus]|uniref:HMG box-containing protein 4 n=1 Tax=Fopius arisanus TaxID=64838 RepID=A0A0C9RJ68_9HYME|nr:PREDICTED: HMG box-containing protein 4-like [Fopius arisanus]
MDPRSSPKLQKTEDLEVTGISRSGRVRKKSSKLVDFESPGDSAEKVQKKSHLRVHFQDHYQEEVMGGNGERGGRNSGVLNSPLKIKHEVSDTETSETEFEDTINDEDSFSMESPSEEEVDPLLIDEKEMGGFMKLEVEQPSQAKSLYMMEKSRKKVCIKDGKIIGRTKAQRKDKGKTRFTAYMLWSKAIRQELIEKCPYMDFAAISKRLGELWSTVPNVEKYNWRRRAKRMRDESVWKTPPTSPKKKFINQIGNGKEISGPPPPKKLHIGLQKPSHIVPTSHFPRASKNLVNEPVVGTGMYKVIGTQPVDVAAHLKLLGESLTIIGERLKEHDGQIAVSGSLSVLLDSLLCALGPLMCLTQQIPETDVVRPKIFAEMLDNIAYVMPGL